MRKIALEYICDTYRAATNGWNRFWFTSTDPATLGLIRILAGAMLFYTHLVWSADLTGFFGPSGRLSAAQVQSIHDSPLGWSHLYGIESPVILWAIHVAALIVFALLTVGLFSRVMSVLAFLLTVSYANRAFGALFGLDQINCLLAFYLMVGPSGAAYSVDSWLRNRRVMKGRKPSFIPDRPRSVSANIAIRLIQVHMCVIYFFAGTGKLAGETWWDGTALWGALANYEYQTIDMTWLCHSLALVNVVTLVTLLWELSYCALIWPRRTRPLVLMLAIPLHLGIAFCMGMITFGLVMLIGNLAFVSPSIVRMIIGRETGAGESRKNATELLVPAHVPNRHTTARLATIQTQDV